MDKNYAEMVIKLSKQKDNSNEVSGNKIANQCCICCENIKDGENYLGLSVGDANVIHEYHSPCITDWFNTKYTNPMRNEKPEYIFN